jgi:hypothetical protein
VSGINGSLYVAVFAARHFILKVLSLSNLPNMSMDEGLLYACVSFPVQLVEHMTRLASKYEGLETWAQLLLKYQTLLVDFQHGEQLKALGCGVDVQRFMQDTQYKQDSILGLAM